MRLISEHSRSGAYFFTSSFTSSSVVPGSRLASRAVPSSPRGERPRPSQARCPLGRLQRLG
jgi:hypothetical protein